MGRMKQSQITYWCHEIIRSQAEEGGYYIDATMGKGNDTLFLCELAGEKGKVLAFDIQQEALDVTKELLKTHGKEMQAELILDGHEHMDRYPLTVIKCASPSAAPRSTALYTPSPQEKI